MLLLKEKTSTDDKTLHGGTNTKEVDYYPCKIRANEIKMLQFIYAYESPKGTFAEGEGSGLLLLTSLVKLFDIESIMYFFTKELIK